MASMATTNPVVDELLTISISTIDGGKEEERLMRVRCHYVPTHVKAFCAPQLLLFR